jgi:hypothetical protein
MAELDEISVMIGRMDGKLDTLLETMAAHVIQDTDRFKEVNQKIDKVSSKQNWMLGAATGISTVIGLVVAFLKT